jgi:hypothetical protein
MFFERALDLVHVITISIRHSSNYSILAGRRVTENYIWNAGNCFTDAELVHRHPPGSTIYCFPTLRTDCDEKKEGISLFAGTQAFPKHRQRRLVLLYGFCSHKDVWV